MEEDIQRMKKPELISFLKMINTGERLCAKVCYIMSFTEFILHQRNQKECA